MELLVLAEYWRIPSKNKCQHPILLPKDGKVTNLIIQHHHKIVAHGGRGLTLNRSIDCCRLRGRIGEQKMADLPACRLT